jgi:hypothetical protein
MPLSFHRERLHLLQSQVAFNRFANSFRLVATAHRSAAALFSHPVAVPLHQTNGAQASVCFLK